MSEDDYTFEVIRNHCNILMLGSVSLPSQKEQEEDDAIVEKERNGSKSIRANEDCKKEKRDKFGPS